MKKELIKKIEGHVIKSRIYFLVYVKIPSGVYVAVFGMN